MNYLIKEKEKFATILWGQFFRLPCKSSSLTYFLWPSFSNKAMYQNLFNLKFDFFYIYFFIWVLKSVLEIIHLSFEKVWLKMVFCYHNCSNLLWERIVLVIKRKPLKVEAEGQEFAKHLRSLLQFVRTVKGQNIFWYKNGFLSCFWRFFRSNELEKNVGI